MVEDGHLHEKDWTAIIMSLTTVTHCSELNQLDIRFMAFRKT